MRGWADVSLWVAVCFLSEISLHRPNTTFAYTLDTVTGYLAVNGVFNDRFEKFHFFIFGTYLYKITVSFTMVIKRSPGGESASGGRSTSKSTCAVPAWSLTAFGDQPASSMSKFSASVNSDLGNGSFWVKIGDAEHVDRCSSECTRAWTYQLNSEMFTFFNLLAMVVSESRFGAYVCL